MNKSANITKTLNSLQSRILVSALLIIVVVLPSIGIALNNAFKVQIEENLREQLNAYFYSVLAVSEFENNDLIMPEALLENQFNVINSGLYALISDASEATSLLKPDTDTQELLWFSDSFLGANLSSTLPNPSVGESRFGQIKVNNEAHFIYSFSVRFDLGEQKSPNITVHIIKDLASVTQQQASFSQQLWTWLLVLILVLLLIQVFWLTWTLKPLARFTQELNLVQTGQTQQLSMAYPKELASVANQLNSLLSNEQKQRKRYRNALSDLAHSLKTPLAVIQSQQDLSETSQEQLTQINRTVNHQLKRAQSAGHNAWHLGLDISPIIEKLRRTLQKIYPNTEIKFSNEAPQTAIFMGDESDLMEILGNLLDNACKAANKNVMIQLTLENKRMCISVEDDGKGISEAQQLDIFQRGKRADTYSKGHGIGLAIVQDLMHTYEGTLKITRSNALGGAKFVVSFPC